MEGKGTLLSSLMGVFSTCCQRCSISSSTLCCRSTVGGGASTWTTPPLSMSIFAASAGGSKDELVTLSYLFRLSSLLLFLSVSSAWKVSASCALCCARAWAMGRNSAQSNVLDRPSRLRSLARLFFNPPSCSTETLEDGES